MLKNSETGLVKAGIWENGKLIDKDDDVEEVIQRVETKKQDALQKQRTKKSNLNVNQNSNSKEIPSVFESENGVMPESNE